MSNYLNTDFLHKKEIDNLLQKKRYFSESQNYLKGSSKFYANTTMFLNERTLLL